jgi:hypothetical protein
VNWNPRTTGRSDHGGGHAAWSCCHRLAHGPERAFAMEQVAIAATWLIVMIAILVAFAVIAY